MGPVPVGIACISRAPESIDLRDAAVEILVSVVEPRIRHSNDFARPVVREVGGLARCMRHPDQR